jgi:hypothetical protein
MNDQNYYVMPNSNNNQAPMAPRPVQAPVAPTQPVAPTAPVAPRPVEASNAFQSVQTRVAPTPQVQATANSPIETMQPAAPKTVANSYEAPKAPQPSGATFDYNQLYGKKKEENVAEKQVFVFEEPEMETSATVVTEEPTITISNDELIPEFDASVLEVLPEQEKKNIVTPQATANVSSMATGKQAEQDKSRSNIIFIAVLFGVIILAVVFLFPIIVKM